MFGVERIGRYEVLGHLASGGMGQVYLARTKGLGGFERQVVVKTLDPDPSEEDALVAMFLDEARLLGRLHHQYIAPIYEVGVDEDGRYFLVMDYVRGETAEAVWKASAERGDAIPLQFALTIGSAIASALDYAHTLCTSDGAPLQIVHRDVSLSNVMIGHDGAVKLIDFGIAKFSNRSAHTQVGTLKGKLAYLSPEQVLHQPVDHRADIFALGAVLYELTTMSRAFHDNSELLTLERIIRGDLVPPSQRMPDYPAELEGIIMKALSTSPADRYSDAGAFGRELERFAATRGLQLGHRAIIELMRRFFDSETGRKRRLARSSSEVVTGQRLAEDLEADTPVQAIEMPEDTEPRSMPVEIVDVPTRRLSTPQPFPVLRLAAGTPPGIEPIVDVPGLVAPPDAPTVAAPPVEAATIEVHFERPRTATAELPRTSRQLPTSQSRTFWVLAGLIVAAIVIAAILGWG